MKKADVIFISACVCVAITLLLCFNLLSPVGKTAKIYIDNKLIEELPLNKNTQKTYNTQNGFNTVIIENGSVSVKIADCKNQVCVNKGKIKNKGETIACTPHKFLVEVK